MDKKTERTLVANFWLILLVMFLNGWNAVENWHLQDQYKELTTSVASLQDKALPSQQGLK